MWSGAGLHDVNVPRRHCRDCILQVHPQCTPANGLSSTALSKGSRPLGGFQPVVPSQDAAQQATYERLLRVAAEVFECKSVWSKAQSSLQRLQVRCTHKAACYAPTAAYAVQLAHNASEGKTEQRRWSPSTSGWMQDRKRRQALMQQEAEEVKHRFAAAIKHRAVTEARRLTAELRGRQAADETLCQPASQPADGCKLPAGLISGGTRSSRDNDHDQECEGIASSGSGVDTPTAATRSKPLDRPPDHRQSSASSSTSKRPGSGKQSWAGRLNRGQLRRSRSTSASYRAATVLLEGPYSTVGDHAADGSGAAFCSNGSSWSRASVTGSRHQRPVGNACSRAKQCHR